MPKSMNNEIFNKNLSLYRFAVSVVGLLLLLLVWLTLRQIGREQKNALRQAHSANVFRDREFVMHLYDSWRALLDSNKTRPNILWLIKHSQDKDKDKDGNEHTLAWFAARGEIDILEKNKAPDPENVQRDVIAALDLFEQIGVAHRDRVGDSELIDQYFRGDILKFSDGLRPFATEWKSWQNQEWSALYDEVEYWTIHPAPQLRIR
jgi:hypothetical protein